MHYLEIGALHGLGCCRVLIGSDASLALPFWALRMGITAALSVGIDIDFKLTHSMIELSRQRAMTIIECNGGLRGELRQPFQCRW